MADSAAQTPGADEFTFPSSESREFPLAPEGVHQVQVSRALFKMRDPHPQSKLVGKQPAIQLMLESKTTYKGEDGKERPYNLFITMTIGNNPKSNMYKFFQSILGIDVPLNANKKITFTPPKVETVPDKEDNLHMTQFEDLSFSVIVKHEKKDDGSGKMRDFVETYFASPEEKALNAQLFRSEA